MADHPELSRATRRTQSAHSLLNARRARLGDRLLQIAASGPCPSTGPRFVLGQNVGTADRPLWAFLSPAVWNVGQLVFSGNRAPIEFSEAQALELAPDLGGFMGKVEFRQLAWASA